MQRYRVNVPLLIGLVVGSISLVGSIAGLYYFQKLRNADRLLDQQRIAREAGDLEKSAGLLSQYLGLREDDEDAMVLLATTLIDIAERPLSEPVDLQRAITRGEQAVRKYPGQTELRRRLLDLYMSPRVRILKSALDHISQLLNRSPGDKDLLAMQSDCLFATEDAKRFDHAYRLIGYDQDTDTFSLEEALVPTAGRVYMNLARTLRTDANEELADRVIQQMLDANPTDGEVHLLRGQYATVYEDEEAANPYLRKALELSPDDPNIVIANARLAGKEERYDEARALLEENLKKNPVTPGLYLALSQIEAAASDLDASIAACERGIQSIPVDQWQRLLVQQTQLQLRSDTPEDARETIKKMRELRAIREAFPDYFEARLLMTENKWFEAAKTFDKYESFMVTASPALAAELNTMLGLCREKLGENELALEAYKRAFQLAPENTAAELGVVRMENKLGGGGVASTTQGGSVASIYQALAIELAKPEAEQDWEAFDLIAQEYVDKLRLGDAMLEVLRGEIFMRRKMYPEAREKLLKSFSMDKGNLGVQRAAVKLFAADPDQGPVKALGLLDRVVKKFGDLPILRLERADLLAVIYPENLTEQLFALADGIDEWTDQQKVQLWRGLAKKFEQLNDNESRAQCLREVAALSNDDLPTLVSLFLIARNEADQVAMQEAQERILRVVKSKENATWLYTEAQRLFSAWRAAAGQGDGRDQAEELVEKALAKRGEWHELHNLRAELLLANRDIRGALKSYDRAASLGKQDPRSAYQHIKLLMSEARYADALQRLESLNRRGRIRVLGKDYAECLLQTGRDAEAVTVAEEYVEQAPKNAATHLWAGRLFSRAGAKATNAQRRQDLVNQAGAAFQESVKTNSRSAESWMQLVGYYAATKQLALADDTIREAQLVLDEDQNLLMFARCYETVGRRVDAEGLYQQALETAKDEALPRVARLAAQFYLGPAYSRPDAIQRATPLINSVLRRIEEGDLAPNDANARWARSTAARLLAKGRDYQQLRDAERLLSSNAIGGVLPVADRLLMAEILAPRPEPVSRLKASRLLEQIRENQQLSKASEMNLARLYFALGEWRKCRQQIESIIARYPSDPQPRLTYLEMLLQRGGGADIDRAVRQVKRLYELAPNALTTREMLARIAHKKGEDRKATSTLLSLLPKKAKEINEQQLPLIRRVAQRLVEFEEFDKARRLYELAAKTGGLADQANLALFLGQHIDADEGFTSLESLADQLSDIQRIQLANQILRSVVQRDEAVPETVIQRVEGWVQQALREDPDLIGLRLQQAELLDIQRRYEEAEAAYQEILSDSELQGTPRAVVLNNLSYLLALSDPDSDAIDRAEEYVGQAIELIGPSSDILDTRAVVAIADSRYDDAIEDLQLAVLDNPTASKYYHLAVAYLRAKRADEASTAWDEAVERGLTRETVSRLEREQYDRVRQQIESGALTGIGS